MRNDHEAGDTSAVENSSIENTTASSDGKHATLMEKLGVSQEEKDNNSVDEGDGEKREAKSAKLREAGSKDDVLVSNLELDNDAVSIQSDYSSKNISK